MQPIKHGASEKYRLIASMVPSSHRFRIATAAVFMLAWAADATAYEIDFHYYLVYAVLRVNGYSAHDADRFAGFSQFVDDNPATEPLFTNAENRREFHFAGSGDRAATQADVMCIGTTPKRSLIGAFQDAQRRVGDGEYVAGQLLHLVADTFSHDKFTAWRSVRINCWAWGWRHWPVPCTGHSNTAEGGHAPDRPYNDVNRALAAAECIYQLTTPTAPPASAVSWFAVKADLGAAMTPSSASGRSLKIRVYKLRDVIKRWFGEDPVYKKATFKHETNEFDKAVKARMPTWKSPWAWSPPWPF
ncbi:MAG: DUF6765 family protein [Planctomycetota bacterium]